MQLPGVIFAAIVTTSPAVAGTDVFFQEQARVVSDAPMIFADFGASVAVDADTLVAGEDQEHRAHVFVRGGTAWCHQAVLIGDDAPSRLGHSVAVDGDTAVVGTWVESAAYVFTRTGTTWSQQAKLVGSAAGLGDLFGYAVGISGDTVAVGAPGDDSAGASAGAAYVFSRSGTVWTEEAVLFGADTDANDDLGRSVSVSGDTVLAGAPRWDSVGDPVGAAYAFVRTGTVWSEQVQFTVPGAIVGVGVAVSVSGDTAVVSDVAAATRVYVRAGTTWSLQALLDPGEPTATSLGESLAISGDSLVIASELGQGGLDSVYTTTRCGTTWSELTRLTAADGEEEDVFGSAVALSGDTVVVGARRDDSPGAAGAGSAYVFVSAPSPFSAFCDASDGSLASCPCGNAGFANTGCDNAQGIGGVRLRATSFTPETSRARLLGTGFPPMASPTVVAIRSTALEPAPIAFGDGLRCLATPVVRFGATAAADGWSQHQVDHGAGPGTFRYQLWYRNTPASFCDPAAPFNASNGLAIAWP